MGWRDGVGGLRVRPGTGIRGIASAVATAALVVGPATSTFASTATLKRSASNLTEAPLDLVLSPMVGARSVATRIREHDDPLAVRVVFALPGVVWNTNVNIGASATRCVAMPGSTPS